MEDFSASMEDLLETSIEAVELNISTSTEEFFAFKESLIDASAEDFLATDFVSIEGLKNAIMEAAKLGVSASMEILMDALKEELLDASMDALMVALNGGHGV